MPALVIGAIFVGRGGLPEGNQAGLWGSLLPGAWGLQLALRARGSGIGMDDLHLAYERGVAGSSASPTPSPKVCCCRWPTTGDGFKPAPANRSTTSLHRPLTCAHARRYMWRIEPKRRTAVT